MAKIGYARVSTADQNLVRQTEQLEKAGCTKIFQEKVSGASVENRTELKNLLYYIRDDDLVIVTELDRLGRNYDELTGILNQIRSKGATFECLNMPALNGIADKNLRNLLNSIVIELFKYIAESERKRIRERQRQGIEIAKLAGKYKGRKRSFPDPEHSPRLQLAIEKYKAGMSFREIEKLTAIPASTFNRYRKLLNIKRESAAKKRE